MRKLLLTLIAVFMAVPAFADQYVHGYYRRDGSYVQSYHRSDANGTTSDNWSTRGNVNPYTGKYGTRSY